MSKRLFSILCIFCMLFTGCGKTDANEDTTATTMTPYAIYLELEQEIGTDMVGGTYYDDTTGLYHILLTQEALDARKGRELTDTELALDHAVDVNQAVIDVCEYSKQELLDYLEIVQAHFSEDGIIAVSLNEQLNKVHVYVHENTDLSDIYAQVPETAITVSVGDYRMQDL